MTACVGSVEPVSPEGPQKRRGETGRPETLEGFVVRGVIAADSKSAREQPLLRLDSGEVAQVHVEGDNPFEEETLAAHDGQRCRVVGVWKNGVLRVQGIEVLTDDWERT